MDRFFTLIGCRIRIVCLKTTEISEKEAEVLKTLALRSFVLLLGTGFFGHLPLPMRRAFSAISGELRYERWPKIVIESSPSIPGKLFFLKSGPFPASLFIFVFSIQLIINKLTNKCSIKFCQWLESNHGPLILQATALPTEPQPLPTSGKLKNEIFLKTFGA